MLEEVDGKTAFIPIAEYSDWENPADTVEKMTTYAVACAANSGANGVLLLNSRERIKNLIPNADPRIGFVCLLCAVPKFHLGVEFETGQAFENRFVIRRIHNPDAERAGLRIGDNILALDGVDIFRNKNAAERNSLKWDSDKPVQVTIARDGKEITVPVRLVSNLP